MIEPVYERSIMEHTEPTIPNDVVKRMIGYDTVSPARAWCEHLKLTQAMVARRMGITQSAYAFHERDDAKLRPGFHLLRRTAASRLSRHLPIHDLQKIMGWSSMLVAARYLAPSDELQAAAVAKAFE